VPPRLVNFAESSSAKSNVFLFNLPTLAGRLSAPLF
jgi:hypothetical protein